MWRSRPSEEKLSTPWRDTVSVNRPGWRERAAYLGSEEVFAVDYQICRTCGLGGWKSRTLILTISDVGLLPQDWRRYAARIKGWNGTLSAATFEIQNRFGRRLAQGFTVAMPNGISVPTEPLANGITVSRGFAMGSTARTGTRVGDTRIGLVTATPRRWCTWHARRRSSAGRGAASLHRTANRDACRPRQPRARWRTDNRVLGLPGINVLKIIIRPRRCRERRSADW
jgi:hypothetical protein